MELREDKYEGMSVSGPCNHDIVTYWILSGVLSPLEIRLHSSCKASSDFPPWTLWTDPYVPKHPKDVRWGPCLERTRATLPQKVDGNSSPVRTFIIILVFKVPSYKLSTVNDRQA